MSDDPIRFDDGAAYEIMMGVWSRRVGETFLDWLAPQPGLRWIDVGCGNGAFTELLVERCVPTAVLGVDPFEGQLAYARERHTAGVARFERGVADDLPADADAFDHAVMAFVIFFAPDPPAALAEMKRVVRPGGTICSAAWDLLEPEGAPGTPFWEELRALGVEPTMPPSAAVSRMEPLTQLWREAGLTDVRTRQITVSRVFDSFDAYWRTNEAALGLAPPSLQPPPEIVAQIKERLRTRMPADASGRVAYNARANAITGRSPG